MPQLTAEEGHKLRKLIQRVVAAELSWQRNWPRVARYNTNLLRLQRKNNTNIELENFIIELEGRTKKS